MRGLRAARVRWRQSPGRFIFYWTLAIVLGSDIAWRTDATSAALRFWPFSLRATHLHSHAFAPATRAAALAAVWMCRRAAAAQVFL